MKKARNSPRTTLFTANGCAHCRQARTFLQQNRIPFVELNINRSPKAVKQLQQLGARGVPVLKHGHTVLFGFVPKQWQKALL